MVSVKLLNLVKDLSQRIIDAPDKLQRSERNEEWTKMVFILPLLEGLGWDKATDVSYESKGPDDVEGSLDFVLKCQPLIGIEAKALDVNFPRDREHPQVKKGLKQTEDRGASYFIWTNGDCWQFYSLALANAPIYQVILSSVGDGEVQIESIIKKLRIIEKENFSENPKIFDKEIRKNWKMVALPAAWNLIFDKHSNDIITIFEKGLPPELKVKSDEILEFLKTLKLSADVLEQPISRTKESKKTLSFPDAWENLLNSYEPDYERSRKRFRNGYYLDLGQYIISENCQAWSKSTTWRHIGAPNDANERKKLGPVISLFRKFRFIEEEKGTDKYKRVEESVQYLKNILEKPASP